ncbi:MAG: T9SS type A sorting domain-containing protein [Sediminibacterium sp.]|nr:T9SS type A sorting domain-containing protein [Sediminibacterium sp.]MDP1810363.1 T9SS type A sorting domain-containing protein [Sediminibacterium sp.]MDP3128535.1 T9SS type A sorting domain-containing protein [Sediminibacterium sp.]
MKPVLLICWIALFSFNLCFAQVVIKTFKKTEIRDSGYFNKSSKFKDIRLSESNISAALVKEKNIQLKDIKRFDHKFDTVISLTKLMNWEQAGKFSVCRIKISVPDAPSIRLYFKKIDLPDSTEMYIYNGNKTTILGPITRKDNTRKNQLWGTNVFIDSSVFIEIKVATAQKSKIILDLNNILFGFRKNEPSPIENDKLDSLQTAYFGQSSSCNINVLCSTGSGYDKERAGVGLVLLPDGSCSGFMVNDVCNSMTPYFMTAYHATNGRSPSDWQYIFHYWSPTCSPNQDGNYSLLFNGASVLATWIQSDFSLLQLYEQPSINSGITYLGWSRSTTAPSSSVGIHHPYGDVMKIAVENNTASVGNIQGYSNTGWRVLFDLGAVESGSSGSPLFDPNKLVVGQLYSSTQPNLPCNTQSGGTNYGRFDVSWDGGGSSGTRLKDWLDPTNTGATSMATLDPINDFALSGANTFCSGSQTYTFATLPSGMSLSSWSISPLSGVVSMSTSGNMATLTYVSDGMVTLTATISNSCSNGTIQVQKIIGVGGPTLSFYIDPLWYTENHIYCTNSFDNNFQIISGALTNVTAFEWGISPSTVIDANGWLEERGVYFSSGGYYQIYARAKNSCGYGSSGTATLNIYVNDNCTGGLSVKNKFENITAESSNAFTLYPNPAGNVLYVTTPDNIDVRHGLLRIIDISGREVKRNISLSKGQTNVNIAMLSKGNYLVEITDGKKKYSKKLIKK